MYMFLPTVLLQYTCTVQYVLLYVLLLQKILTMDQYDCGKRYVCELGVLAVVEGEEGEGVKGQDPLQPGLLPVNLRHILNSSEKVLWIQEIIFGS